MRWSPATLASNLLEWSPCHPVELTLLFSSVATYQYCGKNQTTLRPRGRFKSALLKQKLMCSKASPSESFISCDFPRTILSISSGRLSNTVRIHLVCCHDPVATAYELPFLFPSCCLDHVFGVPRLDMASPSLPLDSQLLLECLFPEI